MHQRFAHMKKIDHVISGGGGGGDGRVKNRDPWHRCPRTFARATLHLESNTSVPEPLRDRVFSAMANENAKGMRFGWLRFGFSIVGENGLQGFAKWHARSPSLAVPSRQRPIDV